MVEAEQGTLILAVILRAGADGTKRRPGCENALRTGEGVRQALPTVTQSACIEGSGNLPRILLQCIATRHEKPI